MYKKLKADIVFPITSEKIENGVIILDQQNKILKIDQSSNYDEVELQYFKGFLAPGFINAHCHLELSHLMGIANTGTGLIDFITQVIKNRNHSLEIIQKKIQQAENEMLESGIVAVGDISNTTDTFVQKLKNNLKYYTFVEYFDMFQTQNTQSTIEQYDKVFQALKPNDFNKISKVPHAPYSVSPSLFSYIMKNQEEKTISIHNQETQAEDELFKHQSGKFIDFYTKINFSTDKIPKYSKSIYYALEFLSKKNRNLFVHNTHTTKEDIEYTFQKLEPSQTYWCTCPNANLYIENTLPNYKTFIDTNAQVCVGTDSLTSNWQLSVFEELKTILKYNSYINFEQILTWATINGAKALGWQNQLGSLDIGKTPGIVHINNVENQQITPFSTSKRIV